MEVMQPLLAAGKTGSTTNYKDKGARPELTEGEREAIEITARELEVLSKELLLALYHHHPIYDRFAALSTQITPEIRPEILEDSRRPRSRNTTAEVGVDIVNASAEVDIARGKASVYVFFVLKGCQDSTRGSKERVDVWEWRRKAKDAWACVRHTGLHGPAGFA